MPDVGEDATLTLTVSPHDGTTSASVGVVSPSGVESTLSATSSDGGATWTAYLPLTEAGGWQVRWEVTGQGSGVETDTVYAFGPVTGRTYATLSDLASWLGEVPPGNAARLLLSATRRVDLALTGAWYPVDDDSMPTDSLVAAALRDAVCAQVAWWVETGDTTGSGAGAEWSSVSIGKLSLSRGGGGSGSRSASATSGKRLAEDAIDILTVAGLLPIRTAWWG